MAAHAYSLLDSYIYGFALTKMNLPFQSTAEVADVAQTMLEPFPMDAYPNLVEFITEHAMKPGYDYADEFGWGLDAVLDALEGRFAEGSMSRDRARSASLGRPEERLILLVDGDPVAVGVGHRKRPPEGSVERLRDDRDAVRDVPARRVPGHRWPATTAGCSWSRATGPGGPAVVPTTGRTSASQRRSRTPGRSRTCPEWRRDTARRSWRTSARR